MTLTNVGHLRRALEGVSDDTPLLIEHNDERALHPGVSLIDQVGLELTQSGDSEVFVISVEL